MSGRRWRLVVPGQPMSPNRRNKASLRARIRDKMTFRDAVAWQSRQAYVGPPQRRAHVVVTLVRCGGTALDPDNAVAVVKPLVDGLCVGHGGTLLADDDGAHLSLEVRQEQGPARQCVIEVEEL